MQNILVIIETKFVYDVFIYFVTIFYFEYLI
jgi:hypothetical protein